MTEVWTISQGAGSENNEIGMSNGGCVLECNPPVDQISSLHQCPFPSSREHTKYPVLPIVRV